MALDIKDQIVQSAASDAARDGYAYLSIAPSSVGITRQTCMAVES